MNATAAADYAKVDKELNVVYQQIRKKYAKDTLFIGFLKDAQHRWIDFRDAEFKRYMPHFMQGNTEGLALGRRVAAQVWAKAQQYCNGTIPKDDHC